MLEPAYKATVTDLLSKEDYAKASGMVQIAANSKYLISPFLAGMLLSVTDIRAILIIDMATFFVTVFTIAAVRKSIKTVKPEKHHLNFFTELKEGMLSITGDKGVRSLVTLMALMCFFIAFIQTLMTPMILTFADSKTLGTIESISAIGMVIGSAIIGVLNIKQNYSKILMLALMAAGAFIALTGTTTKVGLILAFCIMFFTALPFVNTCADVLIRMRISNEVQGRAWGMISILTQMGFVAAYAVCVFGPVMMKGGILAGNVGKLIGTGEGRGIGLMLIIAGIMMVILALVFGNKQSIKEMERSAHGLVNC